MLLLFSSNLDKLAPRSIRCVFLGYSRTQRGYRCYIPASRKYIVFADVTFHENQCFFASDPSSSDRVPLPCIVESSGINVNDAPTTGKEVSKTLQVYQRRSHPLTATSSSPSTDLPPTDLHLPIAIRKGTCVSTVHPISHFVSYDRFHLIFHTFALSIISESIPKNY